jgi:PAS domain-containing protein
LGIPEVKTVLNIGRTDCLLTLSDYFQRAKDTLIFYYIGHGVLADDGSLYLVAADTTRRGIGLSGISFHQTLKPELLKSPARRKIVIFDCCFSGRIFNNGLGDASSCARSIVDVFRDGQEGDNSNSVPTSEEVEGTYVIASTSPNELGLAKDGRGHTAFSGKVIEILRSGVVDQSEESITIEELYEAVRAGLVKEGKPEPKNQKSRSVENLIIARNRMAINWRPSCAVVSAAVARGERRAVVSCGEQLITEACTEAHFATSLVNVRQGLVADPRCFANLDSAAVTAFYMRESARNPSVHLLLGYRYRTGLPTLCFAQEGEAVETGLPVPVVLLPSSMDIESTSGDDEKRKQLAASLANRIEEEIEKYMGSMWQSSLPIATWRMDFGQGIHSVAEASPAALPLFNLRREEIPGATLDEVMARLRPCVRDAQWGPFSQEQARLAYELTFRSVHPIATKPIWLKECHELDPSSKRKVNGKVLGKAFLPVVVQYARRQSVLMLLVMYLDVTNNLVIEDGVASCPLLDNMVPAV